MFYISVFVLLPEGDSVQVTFSYQNKTTCYYVGKVLDNNKDCTVKFLKKFKSKSENNSEFVWPSIDDVGMVLQQDIMVILPEPSVGKRGELLFEVNFQIIMCNN